MKIIRNIGATLFVIAAIAFLTYVLFFLDPWWLGIATLSGITLFLACEFSFLAWIDERFL